VRIVLAPLNRGSLNSNHINGAHVPAEEPSTASISDTPAATPRRGIATSQRSLPTRHDRHECLCSLRRPPVFDKDQIRFEWLRV